MLLKVALNLPPSQKRAVAEPGEEVPTFDQDDFPKKKKRRRLVSFWALANYFIIFLFTFIFVAF